VKYFSLSHLVALLAVLIASARAKQDQYNISNGNFGFLGNKTRSRLTFSQLTYLLSLTAILLASDLANAAVIETTFAGGNSRRGSILDVEIYNPLTVESVSVNLESGYTGEVFVYYKTGTWVGSEANSSAWTLAGSQVVTSNGTNTPTLVEIPDFALSPGIYGFFLTTDGNTSGVWKYTNGSTSYSNSDLKIFAGRGTVAPFDGNITSEERIWNGSITYSLSGSPAVPEPASISIFALGSIGMAYRARRKSKCKA
jgi:hypothetical protein